MAIQKKTVLINMESLEWRDNVYKRNFYVLPVSKKASDNYFFFLESEKN